MTDQEKLFTCPHCDREMAVSDPRNRDRTRCSGCGWEYRLIYLENQDVWELEPISQTPAEQAEDRPFSESKEEGAPREDDFEKWP